MVFFFWWSITSSMIWVWRTPPVWSSMTFFTRSVNRQSACSRQSLYCATLTVWNKGALEEVLDDGRLRHQLSQDVEARAIVLELAQHLLGGLCRTFAMGRWGVCTSMGPRSNRAHPPHAKGGTPRRQGRRAATYCALEVLVFGIVFVRCHTQV